MVKEIKYGVELGDQNYNSNCLIFNIPMSGLDAFKKFTSKKPTSLEGKINFNGPQLPTFGSNLSFYQTHHCK